MGIYLKSLAAAKTLQQNHVVWLQNLPNFVISFARLVIVIIHCAVMFYLQGNLYISLINCNSHKMNDQMDGKVMIQSQKTNPCAE